MNKPNSETKRPAVVDSQTLIYERIEDRSSERDFMALTSFDAIDHVYNGSDGFRDRSYLVSHTRETGYLTRRKASYYINIFKPVVNCMVDPVFSEPIKREFSNDTFQDFIENADNCGTPMENIVKSLIGDARRKDISFCVMDNFAQEELVEYQNAEQARKARKFPYICMKKVQEVYKWTVSKQGALESIDFFDEKIKGLDLKDKNKEVQTYKRWDAQAWLTYWIKKGEKGEETEMPIASGIHGLGVIPVYPVLDFCSTKNLSKLPDPNLYDLAALCFALFNKESEVVSLEMFQCFSLLCLSGADSNTIQTIGAANFISVSNDSKFPPSYASPDAAHLVNLVKNCDRLEEKIYKYAQQKGVIAVRKESSGISKEWDFRAEEAVLKATAKAAANLETWIADTFQLYTKETFDYNVVYTENFQPNFKQEQVKEGLTIIDMNPPASLAARIWKRIAIVLFGRDEDTKDTLIEELDEDMVLRREEAKRRALNPQPKEENPPPEGE